MLQGVVAENKHMSLLRTGTDSRGCERADITCSAAANLSKPQLATRSRGLIEQQGRSRRVADESCSMHVRGRTSVPEDFYCLYVIVPAFCGGRRTRIAPTTTYKRPQTSPRAGCAPTRPPAHRHRLADVCMPPPSQSCPPRVVQQGRRPRRSRQ